MYLIFWLEIKKKKKKRGCQRNIREISVKERNAYVISEYLTELSM